MSPSTQKKSWSASKEARVAGLRNFQAPTLEAVERRRWQLWAIAAFSIFAMSGAGVLLSYDNSPLTSFTFLPAYVIRILILGFAALLGIYLFEKESRLRNITRALVDERVLSAALSNRLKELSILSEVGKAINQVLDLEDVLRMILGAAVDLLAAEEGSVMLVDEERQVLVVSHAYTTRGNVVEGAEVKIGEGVSGWVAEKREPLLITGKAPEGRFKKLNPREGPISSALSVPLIGQDELYGVLNVGDVSGEREFSEYDLRALGLFAEHAAIAIRNARTFEHERQAVVRLEEVDRMKTEFIATVSHELRTPLTSIIGCAKTVRRRSDAMSEIQREEFLLMIERQGERLLKMVEEILSASRIESGETIVHREELDLSSLIHTVAKGFEATDHSRVVRVEGPDSLVIFGDPMSVEQIFSNLVDNAFKYSEPGTAVTIEMQDVDSEAVVRVIDRGAGIPDGEIGGIFDRFRQVDQSSTRRAGGVGLGLYIVRKLVEDHGGSISVESRPGEGSTFLVSFPKRKGE